MMILLGFVLGVVFCWLLMSMFFGGLGNSPTVFIASIVGMVLIVLFVIGSALGVQLSF